MSRRHSLSVQLFYGILLSSLAAAAVFSIFLFLGNQVLDHTVYGKPFLDKMTDRQFSMLQDFVRKEEITAEKLRLLDIWCSRGDTVYLSLYRDRHILYESTAFAKETMDDPEFDPEMDIPDREYTLKLSDGMEVRALLYYFNSDAYYYGTIILSAIMAFAAFSLCFISLVHRKLRYIQQLKSELDILAGGDLSYQVTIRGSDELSELAVGIDQMRRSISAHEAAEERMRSANAELVTAMSHDLRTPLTSLLAYLELIDRGKYEGEAQLHHFVGRSLEKALRIKEMADKLFEYFLVYSSEWEQPELEQMDADNLFQQLWGEYAFSLENGGFTVRQDLRELDGDIQASPDLLRRAFDNLYSNLLKYADPEKPVEISCQREGQEARLELVNRVSPLRDKKQSTNIGLNTCERIIRAHGGCFQAIEENALFRVTVILPLADKAAPVQM